MSFLRLRAVLTVELAALAYSDSHEHVKDRTTDLGLDSLEVLFDEGTDTEGIIARDDDHLYLVFRGTESRNPRDWLTDADFQPTAGPLGGQVHSGFLRALDAIWPTVVDSAERLRGYRTVVVTGHSLGAGLATLAAARCAELMLPVAAVHLYGAPRPGLDDFRDAYDAMLGEYTYRFVNHIDIVTRIPLLIQGYRNVGRRMYFDRRGRLHEDAGAWMIARDDVLARLRHFGTLRSAGTAPHAWPRYTEVIQGI